MTSELSKDDVVEVRTTKFVRLRVGVFATGAAVDERQQPRRVVHMVDIAANLDAPEGVTAKCGLHFEPGTLIEVPGMTMEPHRLCQRRSRILPAAATQPSDRVNGQSVRADLLDRAEQAKSLTTGSRATITAQWLVNNPVFYIQHVAQRECVDLAISGPLNNEVIAHIQLSSPLEVISTGHNLVNAGFSLAKTLGVDVGSLDRPVP